MQLVLKIAPLICYLKVFALSSSVLQLITKLRFVKLASSDGDFTIYATTSGQDAETSTRENRNDK